MNREEFSGSMCNLCGGTEWRDFNGRRQVCCIRCGSFERTRAVKLVLDALNLPQTGHRVLHMAPERGLSESLRERCGGTYEPVDFDPERYAFINARKLDLVTEAPLLESNSYDLILHNHVLEHIPCSIAFVLYHLHRALKPTGRHVFSVPLMSGHYDEFLGPLTPEEATARFGQFDHVRRFARADIDKHLGQMLNLDLDYSLYKLCPRAELDRYNIPESERKGLNGSTIFVVSKHDFRLSL